MPERKGLGRGLGALLGEETTRDAHSGYLSLRVAEVEPNRSQPRRHFDDTALADLADSIRLHGVITPLIVRRRSSGAYQIIAGERRWRAARMAGLTHLPAIVLDADDRKVAELALIENLQREDLNALEIAEGYRSLMDEFGMTQEDVARQVGRSRPAVTNALRLLSLPDAVKERLADGALTEGHARALLALPNASVQEKAAVYVEQAGLSVRQTEAYVKKLLSGEEPKPAPTPAPPNYLEEHERRLSERFSRRVRIVAARGDKGRVELEFYNPEDLESLLERLES
jgi:ParB family chromosome partitioning protein